MHPVISAYLTWQQAYMNRPKRRDYFDDTYWVWFHDIEPKWEWFDELTNGEYRYYRAYQLASPFFSP